MLKLLLILPVLIILPLTAIAYANPLESHELKGESAAVTLDIQFGHNNVKVLPNGEFRETPTLDSVILDFYGDIIDLTDSKVKVTKSGEHFRISNQDEGILIYGHFNDGPNTYRTNVSMTTDSGFQKFPLSTAFHIEDDVIITDGVIGDESRFIPGKDYISKLDIIHEVETAYFMQEDFTVKIRAFDANIENAESFRTTQGGLEGVDIKVELQQEETYERNVIADVFVTEIKEGQWKTLQTIEDRTNKFGNAVSSQKLVSSYGFETDRDLRVVITATLGDQIVKQEVITQLKRS